MASKSRHKRGKQSFPSKKKRRKQAPIFTSAEEEVAIPTIMPTTPLPVTTHPVAATESKPTLATANYPFIASELKRIGIMAGIMLAVLIVLSRVLS